MPNGVLLMAYGAPDRLEDVAPFYTDIRGGRPPPPALLEALCARYVAIGGCSPLLGITRRQAAAVQRVLGDDYRVYVGMRHWTPWIRDAVDALVSDGIREAVALVLAPHYSRLSVGAYMQRLDEALVPHGNRLNVRRITDWHLHPGYLAALEARVRAAFDRWPAETRHPPYVIFTAHSLPERIRDWADPYPDQLLATAQALAQRLNLARWSLGYQSAGRTPEPWLGPDLLNVIDTLAADGERDILVCVIGFVADHLEVLYDVDLEAKPYAAKRGLRLERIDMLNDAPDFAAALAGLARDAFERDPSAVVA